jgi:hypothetical protein
MSTLFSPISIGSLSLTHRVVMAPLPGDVPNDLLLKYYSQRVSRGGLVIGEGTTISTSARGWLGAPGLYSGEQVEGWKKITAAVHAKNGYMFAQLWHTGRASHVSVTGGPEPVSASVNPDYWSDPDKLTSTPGGCVQPSLHRALKISEMAGIVDDKRRARRCKCASRRLQCNKPRGRFNIVLLALPYRSHQPEQLIRYTTHAATATFGPRRATSDRSRSDVPRGANCSLQAWITFETLHEKR